MSAVDGWRLCRLMWNFNILNITSGIDRLSQIVQIYTLLRSAVKIIFHNYTLSSKMSTKLFSKVAVYFELNIIYFHKIGLLRLLYKKRSGNYTMFWQWSALESDSGTAADQRSRSVISTTTWPKTFEACTEAGDILNVHSDKCTWRYIRKDIAICTIKSYLLNN